MMNHLCVAEIRLHAYSDSWDDLEGFSIKADKTLEMILPEPEVYTTTVTKAQLEGNQKFQQDFATFTLASENYNISINTNDFRAHLGKYMDLEIVKKDVDGNEIYTYNALRGKFFKISNVSFGTYTSDRKDVFNHIEVRVTVYDPILYKISNEMLLKKYQYEEIEPEELTQARFLADGGMPLMVLM